MGGIYNKDVALNELQEQCTYQRAMSTPSTTKAVGAAGFELSADTVPNGATAAAAVAAAALFCRLCALGGALRCARRAKHDDQLAISALLQ
eukprot:19294-Heterococcus_DN1.PRE.3